MQLSEDLRKNPGTLALTASWVVVFALIQLVQWRHPVPVAPGPMFDPLPVSTLTSHRFGDMTWLEVRQGHYWRLITATFIHFGLIHLVVNSLAMINLGRLVEPWYRTGPFLAICLIIGGLGNLVGGAVRQLVGLARPWMVERAIAWHLPNQVERFLQGGPGGPVSIHTGGGSTILLGLLTLATVVGWRSRTRIGQHLKKQMLLLIGLTAVLGVGMYQLVDNYGHLGGAIVGAVLGLFNAPLRRWGRSIPFRRFCWVGVAVTIIGCLGIGIRDDRVEVGRTRQITAINDRVMFDDRFRTDLDQLYGLYVKLILRSPYFLDPDHELDSLAIVETLKGGRALSLPKQIAPDQLAEDKAALRLVVEHLETGPLDLWGSAVADDLARLRDLGRSALDNPIDYQNAYEFLVAWKPAIRAIAQDEANWNARRMEMDRIARQPH